MGQGYELPQKKIKKKNKKLTKFCNKKLSASQLLNESKTSYKQMHDAKKHLDTLATTNMATILSGESKAFYRKKSDFSSKRRNSSLGFSDIKRFSIQYPTNNYLQKYKEKQLHRQFQSLESEFLPRVAKLQKIVPKPEPNIFKPRSQSHEVKIYKPLMRIGGFHTKKRSESKQIKQNMAPAKKLPKPTPIKLKKQKVQKSISSIVKELETPKYNFQQSEQYIFDQKRKVAQNLRMRFQIRAIQKSVNLQKGSFSYISSDKNSILNNFNQVQIYEQILPNTVLSPRGLVVEPSPDKSGISGSSITQFKVSQKWDKKNTQAYSKGILKNLIEKSSSNENMMYPQTFREFDDCVEAQSNLETQRSNTSSEFPEEEQNIRSVKDFTTPLKDNLQFLKTETVEFTQKTKLAAAPHCYSEQFDSLQGSICDENPDSNLQESASKVMQTPFPHSISMLDSAMKTGSANKQIYILEQMQKFKLGFSPDNYY